MNLAQSSDKTEIQRQPRVLPIVFLTIGAAITTAISRGIRIAKIDRRFGKVSSKSAGASEICEIVEDDFQTCLDAVEQKYCPGSECCCHEDEANEDDDEDEEED